jgi:hypothetical protein
MEFREALWREKNMKTIAADNPLAAEAVQTCADWDVMALQSNRPRDWHRWHYGTICQWVPGVMMLSALQPEKSG